MSLLCEEYVLSDNISTGSTSNTSNSSMGSESELDRNRAKADLQMTKDPRIVDNMLLLEKSTVPHCDYFATVQTDIKPFMRKLVTIWMLELCDEQRVEEQVFPLAINFMDRFLCVCNISRQQLQLLGATCLLVAAKIRQCHSLPVDLLCAYTDCTITPEQVKVSPGGGREGVVFVIDSNWNVFVSLWGFSCRAGNCCCWPRCNGTSVRSPALTTWTTSCGECPGAARIHTSVLMPTH